MRWPGPRAGIAAGALCSLLVVAACTQSFCVWGIKPFDGAGGLHPNTVLELRYLGALPFDLPPLTGGVVLRDLSDGRPVDITLDISPREGRVRVIPVEPLIDGNSYELEGVDTSRAASFHEIYGWNGGDLEPSTARFTIGGPVLAARVSDCEGDSTLELTFSEPMDLESFRDHVRGLTFDERVVAPDDIRTLDEQGIVYELTFRAGGIHRVQVLEGAGQDGTPLTPDRVLTVRCDGPQDAQGGWISRLEGAATCGF